MNYPETIEYIFHKLPMFSRLGAAAYKKDLTNIKALLAGTGNPHNTFKTVHVGGTNGKGSVSHMMAAVLQKAGYKTGLYTSPHLYDFRERIKINGDMIPGEFVVEFIQETKEAIEQIAPSFFEITVAMAFGYFARQKVDIAIIEVGLGGRLDSTNIISPLLSVITNISLDHTNLLGTTVKEIAGEKAGIIKDRTPVVIGEKSPLTEEVFTEAAKKCKAPVFFAEDFFIAKDFNWQDGGMQVRIEDKETRKVTEYCLDLTGIYQTKNTCTVLTALSILSHKGYLITDEIKKEGLRTTKALNGLEGRWEVIRDHPKIILDVAHNEAGLQNIILQLEHLSYHRLHIVFGMVKDKEANAMLALLPAEAVYYFTQASIPRALERETLLKKGESFQLKGTSFFNVNDALKEAIENAAPDDLILVCGSIFLVAEVNKQQFMS